MVGFFALELFHIRKGYNTGILLTAKQKKSKNE